MIKSHRVGYKVGESLRLLLSGGLKVRLNEVDAVSCGAFAIHSSLKTCSLGVKHQQSCGIQSDRRLCGSFFFF